MDASGTQTQGHGGDVGHQGSAEAVSLLVVGDEQEVEQLGCGQHRREGGDPRGGEGADGRPARQRRAGRGDDLAGDVGPEAASHLHSPAGIDCATTTSWSLTARRSGSGQRAAATVLQVRPASSEVYTPSSVAAA